MYRFYELKYRNEDPAEITHLFLVQLQKKGVPGITLTRLDVHVKPGSVLVEVTSDEESIQIVLLMCPNPFIKGCKGVLVDPDRPDLKMYEDEDGHWVPDVKDVAPPPAAEPVYPYWYKAENNWIQCQYLMALKLTEIRQEFTGLWMKETRLADQTSGEQMKNWLHSTSGGRVGTEYQPRYRNVRVRDIFQDELFPSDDRSWYRCGEPNPLTVLPRVARWSRLCEYSVDCPYPIMNFAAGGLQPRAGRIYQGAPENFYLCAALQALSMKPQLIANVFCNMEYSDLNLGVYILRFYKHGQWQCVEIDDSLPFNAKFSPLTCQTEFWPALSWATLIEKAYAKVHGSYEGLGGGGSVEEVLTDLTGGCSTRFGTRDVANDRLWMYLYEMQRQCIFACNVNEAECSKRSIPIEKHWASAIWKVAKHEDFLYICVCTAAPTLTCVHMPACMVPSPDGYGVNEGFIWLRIDDFVQLFDVIYECRLVNSDLGPPPITGIECSPGWVPNAPWFEDLWAFQGNVTSESSPCFIVDVPAAPNEITFQASQTDLRFDGDGGGMEELLFGRPVMAPLLLRFYECSREVSEVTGGEIFLVHLSAWGHTRDACTGVKVMKPGRYMVMVSVPAKYTCQKMVFRSYSVLPIIICPCNNHRSYVAVTPARPLGAIPYCLCGFQRVDSAQESLPQAFDESEGRGKPMANPMYEGWTSGSGSHWAMLVRRKRHGLAHFLWPFEFPTPCELLGCGRPRGFLGTGLCRGYNRLEDMRGLAGFMGGGLGGLPGYSNVGMMAAAEMYGMTKDMMGEEDGMQVVGGFGGRDAEATINAKEPRGDCGVM